MRRQSMRARASVRGAVLAWLLLTGGCGDGAATDRRVDPPRPAAGGEAPAARTDAEARLERLNARALRLLVAAAQRQLPIGPLQERISAARMAATRAGVDEAVDRMTLVVADLERLIETHAGP